MSSDRRSGLLKRTMGAPDIVQAWIAPSIMGTKIPTLSRIGAGPLAVALTLFFNILLRASHPPAAATTLLVALGTFQMKHEALMLFLGVVILATLAELARRIRIRATGGS